MKTDRLHGGMQLFQFLFFLKVANIEEAKQMLNFGPERVGHAVKTHPDSGGTSELWEMLKRQSIPVGE